MHLGGRDVLYINFVNKKDKTYGEAVFVVADTKKRWVQELGFEGAGDKGKDSNWADEAKSMLLNVEFAPEQPRR